MNKELQCNIVNDLLPLYMDDLTSEETNSFIKKHLEECQNCQNEYRTFKAELSKNEFCFGCNHQLPVWGMFTCIESWHTCTSKRSSP